MGINSADVTLLTTATLISRIFAIILCCDFFLNGLSLDNQDS